MVARPTAARAALAAAAALLAAGAVRAADAPPPAAGDAAKGKAVFMAAGCAACHVLADAGASGQVGPSLDHDANLSEDLVVARVTNGQGGMPAFAGQISDADIRHVAAYVVKAAAK